MSRPAAPHARARRLLSTAATALLVVGATSVYGKARQRALDNSLVEAVLADDIPAATAALGGGARPDARVSDLHRPLLFLKTPPGEWRESSRLRLDAPMTVLQAATGGLRNPRIADGRAGMVSLLLRHGADPNERGAYLSTPLHAAAGYGNPEVARALLDAGADVNAWNFMGDTPLMVAAKCGTVGRPGQGRGADTVRLLLTRGAHLEATADSGETALTAACFAGNREAFRALLTAGAGVHPARPGAPSPLHLAAFSADPWMLCELLSHGADVDPRDGDGVTPLLWLMHAYGSGRVTGKPHFDPSGSLRVLLEHGANTGVRDTGGKSPLDLARAAGDRRAVRMLERAAKRGGKPGRQTPGLAGGGAREVPSHRAGSRPGDT